MSYSYYYVYVTLIDYVAASAPNAPIMFQRKEHFLRRSRLSNYGTKLTKPGLSDAPQGVMDYDRFAVTYFVWDKGH